MKRIRIIAMAILLLTCGTAALSADTHVVFKTKRIIFGREKVLQWESWACAGKQYFKAPTRPSIIRYDLGLRWELYPGAGTYTERQIAPAIGPANGALKPALKKGEEDLRFAGMDFEEVLEWRLSDAEAVETRHGIECRRHRLVGDSDHSNIEIVVWVAPHGRDKGLALVPEILATYKRNFDADAGMAEIFQKISRRRHCRSAGGARDLIRVRHAVLGRDRVTGGSRRSGGDLRHSPVT